MEQESLMEQEKFKKLRKMRIINTSLLVIMAAIYFVFKRLDTQNLIFSSIAAFAEAAMIGALADWFAVVALFRHPMGMKWIPHTAIIPNNKDRIGESISSFVVSNFFSEAVIQSRLEGIDMATELSSYIRRNRETLVGGLLAGLPDTIKSVFENKELMELSGQEIKKALGKIRLYPFLGGALQAFTASGQHIPITKELLAYIHGYISENKERTLKFLEGLNKTFSLPFIGDLVYWNILKTLARQIEEIESNSDTEVRRLLLYSLPRLADRLKTSEELIGKGEKFKTEVMGSELADNFIDKLITDIKEFLTAYASKSDEAMKEKLNGFMDKLIDVALSENIIKEKINSLIKNSITSVICTYKGEISKLIRHTVEEWEEEDMVRRLEVHVGSDLQFIRINGTVIGGLAGLAIHLVSRVLL